MSDSSESKAQDQTASWKSIQTQVQTLAKKAEQARTEKTDNRR
jgi:hypothetical protein